MKDIYGQGSSKNRRCPRCGSDTNKITSKFDYSVAFYHILCLDCAYGWDEHIYREVKVKGGLIDQEG